MQESDSESDNATEGVIWEARDLWSAPVERSSHGMQARKFNRWSPTSESESESDNATEGVIWKARDLWSAPVERSSHGMQERKSNRLCSLRQGLAAGILGGGGCAFSVRQYSSWQYSS